MTILWLIACTGNEGQSFDFSPDKEQEESETVDLTVDYGGSDADLVWETPSITVPPYTEKLHCYFLTYEGPDVGIVSGAGMQASGFGHHVFPAAVSSDPEDLPDGTLIDCTDGMVEYQPLIEVTDSGDEGTYTFELPEGLGRSLKSGQRIMLESHHVNYSGEEIIVNDRVELYTKPAEEIDMFVSSFWHSVPEIYIPEGVYTLSHTCNVLWNFNFIWLMGHMHGNGTHFAVDIERTDGTTERLYEVDQWDPVYKDVPPVNYYELGELSVSAGDKITTSCTYDNQTGADLVFPEEMCTTMGIVYPAEDIFECYE